MVYTGFIDGHMNDVINPIEIRTRDIIGLGNQRNRFVFNCFIFGHSNSGKSSFLDAIINNGDIQNQSLAGEPSGLDHQ